MASDPTADDREQSEEGVFLNLKESLGGCIFRASSSSDANDFMRMRLFQASEVHFQYIRYIKEGMPIFLLVDDEIWGHFEAAGDGELASKLDGIRLAQVRIKIVRQYTPMPSKMFLPILGAAVNLGNMPLELTKSQAKSLLHGFMNSHLRSQHRRENPTYPADSRGRSYSDSWGYNRLAPPPVPPDRKYTTSVAAYGECMREAQENRGPQPKQFRRPVVYEPRDYLRENKVPPPPPPPPPPSSYYGSAMAYYGTSSDDLQHTIHKYGLHEGGKLDTGIQGDFTWASDSVNKPSKSSQTDPDQEEMELDRRVTALTEEVHSSERNLNQMKEAVRGLEEENMKLKETLREKESMIKRQLLELEDVRAEFFSFYDEENVRQGQPSAQQPVSCSDMMSPPQSTPGYQTPVHTVAPSAPGLGLTSLENMRTVPTHEHAQLQYTNDLRSPPPAGSGRSQPTFERTPIQQKLFPDQNQATQKVELPRPANVAPSQPVGFFYVPDTSMSVEEHRLAAQNGHNPSANHVAQYQNMHSGRQATVNQERVQAGAARLPEPNGARSPEQPSNLPQPPSNPPQPPSNPVAHELPSPRQVRSTNNLGPLGRGFSSPRSHSPSGNQMGGGYQSYVSKGSWDVWDR